MEQLQTGERLVKVLGLPDELRDEPFTVVTPGTTSRTLSSAIAHRSWAYRVLRRTLLRSW